ncbi:hypothetical protein AVEN_245158-1 [Araneus ventricosus]|uniref:Uncharacterized protein n=1 Tax=Araneus ventricosus TaxID=182803 RepID=A0A4Y2M7V5_ARAVE|nr:hypothetical protein AVEN_245158-1 [Araneus ventricosus]
MAFRSSSSPERNKVAVPLTDEKVARIGAPHNLDVCQTDFETPQGLKASASSTCAKNRHCFSPFSSQTACCRNSTPAVGYVAPVERRWGMLL